MSGVLGIDSWVWLVIVAAAICLAAGLLATRAMRRRRNARDELLEEDEDQAFGAPVRSGGRLAVLESTEVDAARRLLLVRCDHLEHLILIGGPSDLVVDSDVGRSRAAKAVARAAEAAPRQAPTPEPAPLPAAPKAQAPAIPAPAAAVAAAPKPEAPPKPAAAPGAAEAPAAAPMAANPAAPNPAAAPARAGRPALATVQPTSPVQPVRNAGRGQPNAAPAIRSVTADAARPEQPRAAPGRDPGRESATAARPEAAPAKPRPAEPPAVRREPSVTPHPRLAPQLIAAPPPSEAPAEPARRLGPARGQDRAEPSFGGPHGPAETEAAWPEPDSIEGEIVRALRVEQDGSAERESAAAKPSADPATTLGDLAERLEEALAREVNAANGGRNRLDLDLDAFGFDRDPPVDFTQPDEPQGQPRPEPARAAEPVRAPQAERPTPRVLAAAPEIEPRREVRASAERSGERGEEAPVISLHARRREAADPLEDEMARLLGELTGDTSRR